MSDVGVLTHNLPSGTERIEMEIRIEARDTWQRSVRLWDDGKYINNNAI